MAKIDNKLLKILNKVLILAFLCVNCAIRTKKTGRCGKFRMNMKIAVYIGKPELEGQSRFRSLVRRLEDGGCLLYRVDRGGTLEDGTDMLLSVGGDGTFLTAAMIASDSGVPVAGVNLGRLGFLSENRPEDVPDDLLSGDYTIEERSLLNAELSYGDAGEWPYALNEMTVHRSGAAMLGVDVAIDGACLPTYWADGLVVSTSSGSTAYSLSVGGPIVLPESKVLIISPIASHNLNVRPIIVPDTSDVRIGFRSRDAEVLFTADNRTMKVPADMKISVSLAHFSLRRVRLNRSDFINALTEKLFWGEDVRNSRNTDSE